MDIDEIYKQCSEEHWDNYAAFPITKETCDNAKRFLKLIPDKYPKPDISPHPDGNIDFEWYKDKGFDFVVGIDKDNILTYAGFYKGEESGGEEKFNDKIPEIIILNLDRLYG